MINRINRLQDQVMIRSELKVQEAYRAAIRTQRMQQATLALVIVLLIALAFVLYMQYKKKK